MYRVEIQVRGAPGKPPVPWVVTNPIYVRARDESPVARNDATETAPQYERRRGTGMADGEEPTVKGCS